MIRNVRTYANDQQIASFSKWLFEKGYRAGQAKEFLEPRAYQVRGTNFGYREVDACLALMELVVGASASTKKAPSKTRNIKARRICDMQ